MWQDARQIKQQQNTTSSHKKKSQRHRKCHVTHLFLPHLPRGKDTVCSWTSALRAAQLFYCGRLWNSALWTTPAWTWPWAPIWFEWWRVVYSLCWSQGRSAAVWVTVPPVVNMVKYIYHVCQVKPSVAHGHPRVLYLSLIIESLLTVPWIQFFSFKLFTEEDLINCFICSGLGINLCSSVCPNILYLVRHSECQRCAGDSGAVGYRSQYQAGLSQELTRQGL